MFLDKIIVAFLTHTISPSFILLSYSRSVIFPPPLRGFMFPPRKFSSGFSILPPSVSASLRVFGCSFTAWNFWRKLKGAEVANSRGEKGAKERRRWNGHFIGGT